MAIGTDRSIVSIMVKRKQINDDDTASSDPPRRSTRHKVTQNVEEEPKAAPIPKQSKKSTKNHVTTQPVEETSELKEDAKQVRINFKCTRQPFVRLVLTILDT